MGHAPAIPPPVSSRVRLAEGCDMDLGLLIQLIYYIYSNISIFHYFQLFRKINYL